jgi:hypothetical protein
MDPAQQEGWIEQVKFDLFDLLGLEPVEGTILKEARTRLKKLSGRLHPDKKLQWHETVQNRLVTATEPATPEPLPTEEPDYLTTRVEYLNALFNTCPDNMRPKRCRIFRHCQDLY